MGIQLEENNFDQTQISNVFSLYYNLKFCPARQGAFVDREKLMCWIQDLQEGLDRNNQNRLFGMISWKNVISISSGARWVTILLNQYERL